VSRPHPEGRIRSNTPAAVKVADLSHAKGMGKAVLWIIATFARPDGKGAFPSEKEIGQRLGLGERAVQKWIAHLAGIGELVIHPRPGRSNVYLIPCAPPNIWTGAPPNVCVKPPNVCVKTPERPFRRAFRAK
jgi:Helix-turn-helix domain